MNFFCPRCHQRITSQDATKASCPGCGMLLDLALADTDPGRPMVPPTRDLTGQRIGPFQLDDWLGSGGMGTVYRATDTASGDTVAVKLLAPLLCRQPDIVERFHREARALQNLVHPRIVGFRAEGAETVGGNGAASPQHFIAMEYVAGETLEAILAREAPLEAARAIGIAGEISEALGAAHHQGIVHRDLKPANVIISPAGVKVLDFGIAHLTVGDGTLTHSDAILGTVNYMAPEQRTRAAAVDHRADIFSLGVILYRSLTGDLPLGSFESVSRLNPALGRRHDRVVTRMLQRDPDQRQADVEEVQVDLRRLLRPDRRPAVLAGVTAALVLLMAVGVGLAFGLGEDDQLGGYGVGDGTGEQVAAIEAGAAGEGESALMGLSQNGARTETANLAAEVEEPPTEEANDEVAPDAPSQLEQAGEAQAAQPATPAPQKGRKGKRDFALAAEPPESTAPAKNRQGKLAKALPGKESAPEPAGVAKQGGEKSAGQPDSFATTKAKRGYYRVMRVASGDTLNVRAKPSAEAPVVGTIAADGRCVSFTGKQKRVGEEAVWWLVEMGAGVMTGLKGSGAAPRGALGWVNAYYLDAEAPGACERAPRKRPSKLKKKPK